MVSTMLIHCFAEYEITEFELNASCGKDSQDLATFIIQTKSNRAWGSLFTSLSYTIRYSNIIQCRVTCAHTHTHTNTHMYTLTHLHYLSSNEAKCYYKWEATNQNRYTSTTVDATFIGPLRFQGILSLCRQA